MHFAWRNTSLEMLGGQGADFLRGHILEHQFFRFAMTSTSFPWQAPSFRQTLQKHWPRALDSALKFLKENWQNCFVFDIFEEVSQSFFVLEL